MRDRNTKSTARASTGVAGLDIVLGGGLPRDKLYLVQGDPGSGKTTVALQFLMEGARRGESVLYISLSESKDDLAGIAQAHGWSLDGVNVHEVKPPAEDSPGADEDYTVFHPGEVELNDLMKDFFTEAERLRPRRVVIDSLSEMRLLARDPLKYRRHLLAIREFFTSRGCTVLLLDAGRAKAEDLQANTLPHGVITLEHASPAFGARRRRLLVAKMRGVKFDDGYHDLRIETGGVVVYPRLIAGEHEAAFDRGRVSSDIPALDRLSGGLARGTSTVIMGSAGVGKSTLAAQFVAAAAARGEPSAVFTFDENVQTFLDRCDGFRMPVSKHVKQGRIGVQQVDPGELSPGEFASRVRRQVEEGGARIIVIDSMNGYLQATPDERFLLVQLHELLTYLAGRGVVTILVVAQHGLPGSPINTAVDISYLADTVFLLRYFESEGEVRKCISLLKNRTGPHELTIRELRLAEGGVHVGRPLSGFHGVLTGTPTFDGPTPPVNGGGADGVASGDIR